LELAIKTLGYCIDVIAAKLAENGSWSVIFKRDTTIVILAQ